VPDFNRAYRNIEQVPSSALRHMMIHAKMQGPARKVREAKKIAGIAKAMNVYAGQQKLGKECENCGRLASFRQNH
jgi:hypothetical protein